MSWRPSATLARMSEFFQAAPVLGNQYDTDGVLRDHLARTLPPEILTEAEPVLRGLGARAGGPMLALADDAEADEPEHVPYDPWGRRIDEIRMSPAWDALGRIAVEAGLTALPYESAFGEHARTVHAAAAYLFAPSSATYLCPVAMTDAAARTLTDCGDPAEVGAYVDRLTTRDPERAWTSGQWMTEREGGSDVGRSATVARLVDGGWRLYGTKFFTSAITSDVALTLARPEGAPGGSRGLSLFLCETHRGDGSWNSIRVNRLKDKLGTRALPTAEIELEGTPALPVGTVEEPGVPKIATMLNVTRLHNALAAAGGMRRCVASAVSYSGAREAFGERIVDLPLHAETVAWITTEATGAFALTFEVARLRGRVEAGTASEDERRMMRILTPLAKLFTGKQAVAVASETLEVFGGAGYMEDTGLPRLLRDAQVLPLWEGTTNVLSLDMLRAIAKDDAAKALLVDLGERLARVRSAPALADTAAAVEAAAGAVGARPGALGAEDRDVVQSGARRLALDLAAAYTGALLLDAALWALQERPDTAGRAVVTARRWAERCSPTRYPEAGDLASARLLLAPGGA